MLALRWVVVDGRTVVGTALAIAVEVAFALAGAILLAFWDRPGMTVRM